MRKVNRKGNDTLIMLISTCDELTRVLGHVPSRVELQNHIMVDARYHVPTLQKMGKLRNKTYSRDEPINHRPWPRDVPGMIVPEGVLLLCAGCATGTRLAVNTPGLSEGLCPKCYAEVERLERGG